MTEKPQPNLTVQFYKTDSGNEPVREWLLKLGLPNKKLIDEKQINGFVRV